MTKSTLIYINFTPYENTGRILDYLNENYKTVILFVFNHHKLGNKKGGILTVYSTGKVIYNCRLNQIPLPQALIFPFLPIKSALISAQVIYHLIRLRKKFGPYDVFFTVNSFIAYIGNLAKKIGLVKKTIIWVWDYYPPKHPNKIITFMRWIYWQFDKKITDCDRVVFLNHKLQNLRKEIGILDKNANYPVVPIGTSPNKKHLLKTRKTVLGFAGVLKDSQGIELIFDKKSKLDGMKNLSVIMIGDGPDAKKIRRKASRSNIQTDFVGYIDNEDRIKKILSKSSIGLAPYIPEKSNVSYYGDPSKIKLYLSLGLPVITTDVFEFSKEIENKKTGIIINYYEDSALLNAINEINNNYEFFSENALKLSSKYEYRKIYKKLFTD